MFVILELSLCILFFFFKFYFIFKLYNIVLVLPNVEMDPPQVYMCSPSWTLLPPPSPYHSSGSSLCTSPKHPVSCIEPGLATRFIHDVIHVSMPFSHGSPGLWIAPAIQSGEGLSPRGNDGQEPGRLCPLAGMLKADYPPCWITQLFQVSISLWTLSPPSQKCWQASLVICVSLRYQG